VAGGFLFWPGENGTIYKFVRSQGRLHPVASLRYREAGGYGAAGVESSLAVCRNYGYFADNHGNIMCINLDKMAPVWRYDNHDDTDATVVLDVAGDVPYLYTCSEVDRQGNSGVACMVALNGLTGEEVWKTGFQCQKAFRGAKSSDGGMYSTPVLGSGDCSHLLFTTICDHNPAFHGKAVAIDRSDGRIVWEHSLKHYAWSSPVVFLNEQGKLFLFQGDCAGNVYLLDGLTGERLFTDHVANNFESSPVVVGDCVVVGSRGNTIYKFRIQ
jgi:outer membrane protein assembly factor BamB